MSEIQTLLESLNRVFARLNPLSDPKPLIDIVIVALIFYWLLGVIRGTRAVQLLRGIGVLLALSILLSSVLPLDTLRWLLTNAIQPTCFAAALAAPTARSCWKRLMVSRVRRSSFRSRAWAR